LKIVLTHKELDGGTTIRALNASLYSTPMVYESFDVAEAFGTDQSVELL